MTKRQRRSKEQWKLLVEEFKASGLSLAAWCREKNISKSSIYPYIKTFDNNVEDSDQKWGVVTIPKITTESAITLKIGSITLDIKSGFNKETLSEVLSVKSECNITEKYCIYIGLTHPHKRFSFLLEALSKVSNDINNNYKIVVVGNKEQIITKYHEFN